MVASKHFNMILSSSTVHFFLHLLDLKSNAFKLEKLWECRLPNEKPFKQNHSQSNLCARIFEIVDFCLESIARLSSFNIRKQQQQEKCVQHSRQVVEQHSVECTQQSHFLTRHFGQYPLSSFYKG